VVLAFLRIFIVRKMKCNNFYLVFFHKLTTIKQLYKKAVLTE